MSAKTAKEPKASYAHLAARAVSDEARALITRIEQLLSDAQPARRITPRTGRLRLDALERFIGHLLIVRADPAEAGSIYRSLHKGTPDEGPVSLYVFRSVLADLTTAGLVAHTPGIRRFLSVGQRFGDGRNQLPGTAATFAATDALIALAAKHGIALEDMPQHFVEDAPLLRLSAMATWEYGGRDADGVWYPPRKINGEELSFAETDETPSRPKRLRRRYA